jgi:hypothetical protein
VLVDSTNCRLLTWNPKPESRNPKQVPRTQAQIIETTAKRFWAARFGLILFEHSCLLRISNCGFWVYISSRYNLMNKLLTLAAVAEAATGLALLIIPSLVGRLLLGAELIGVAIPVARVAGIALIALSVACWPGRTARCGMLTYSALATLYLLYLCIRGEWVGPLLWPAVVLHAILTALLAWQSLKQHNVKVGQ